MGGALRPWMRTLTLEVEHGRGCPCSTYRAQLRIDGLAFPPVGPACVSVRCSVRGLSQTAVHFGENCRIWRVLAEVDCALSKTRGLIGPMGGALRPWMRTLTLDVEHGRGRPCSTYRAQLRIDGCVQPVVGCGA